jgi:hypothetical protein
VQQLATNDVCCYLTLLFTGLSDGATGSTNASTTGGVESHAARTAAVRAKELADVSLKVYEAGGKAIHVPLPLDHPLVVILKEVLGTGSTNGAAVSGAAAKELAALRAGAREVADALLTGVLQQQVRGSSPCICYICSASQWCLVWPSCALQLSRKFCTAAV